ncbi:nucleotide exchange factor GrpE [Sphingomonas sp. G-3-2-10]|jgi:molecular chaperone GrpE|uniref:nucleotide exchange factor GrpE n=1 Tax=Sphingomonas sp. G-3-2-10 TaxID=2728838 RepID=UPI00146D2C44|nr:nucleotide exchange factor GrpE [Sphingomonas sp. G-3-2-10]NML07428.1 nucleotide exchange factor GrpE [Sphingomonas sp. G-3-2-10]
MTKDTKMDTAEANEAETLREETAEAAPEVAEHDRAAELEAELAEAKAALMYAQAETQNVRRRFEKEAADARTYAATHFARDILSVADNLGRALAAIPAELREDEKLKGLVVGLEATGRELDSVFGRHGITKIEALGEALDPNRHQAMMEVPSDKAPGTIVQEIQSGYMIKDRLLRPALVGVAKAG